MKKILLFAGMIPALCAGLLCACATTKTDIKQLEGKWTITAVNGEKIQTEEPPFLEFNLKEMRVHGNTGCNIFNATFKQEDEKDASSLVFNPGMSTMMACPDMATEQAVLKAIGAVKAVKAGQTEQEMQLVDAAGEAVLTLSKQ